MRFIQTSELVTLLIAVLVLATLLFLPYLGLLTFIHEEPRRVLIALEMKANSSYWIPHLLGEVYLSKPPMYNWLLVLSGHLFGGLNEFSARITSVFSMMLMSVFLAIILRRHLSRAALIFFSCSLLFVPELANKVRLAEIEMLFTCLVSLSIWVWYDRYQSGMQGVKLWLLPSLLVGLAFLTKREPAIVFYYLSIFGWLLYRRNLSILFSFGHLVGLLVIGLIGGSWLYWVTQEVGFQAFLSNSQEEVFQRNLGANIKAAIVHLFTYPLDILLACFPFSCLLFGFFNRPLRQSVIERYGDLFYFCLIVVFINLPLYLFRAEVAVRYYLPMFPMLMVLVSIILDTLVSKQEDANDQLRGFIWLSRLIFSLACLVCIGLAVSAYFYKDLYAQSLIFSPMLIFFISLSLLLVLVVLIKKYRHNLRYSLISSLFIFGILFHVFYFSHHLPRELGKHRVDRNMQALVQAVDEQIPRLYFPMQSLGNVPYDVWFYLGYNDRLMNFHNACVKREYLLGFKKKLEYSGLSYEKIVEVPYRGDKIFLVKRKE